MTLDISMLKNIFPFYTKTLIYHLKYPIVITLIFFKLKKLLMLMTNSSILTISERDTLRPPRI